MKLLILISIIFFISCASNGKVDESDPDPVEDTTIENLKAVHQGLLTEAENLRDPETGWIENGCDGMIWSGKYAAASGVHGVNIEAACDDSGRCRRRPESPCWTQDQGDIGSATTWSRDMAVCGLFPYAWRKQKLDLLDNHASYGVNHIWKMGEPLDDGRVLYSSNVFGLLYQLIYALGGDDHPTRRWPGSYPGGLDDYQAHLQMCQIWLRGEIEGINEKMHERIQEHVNREPDCLFYRVLSGIYTGDFQRAIEIALSPDNNNCTYVRCGEDQHSCRLAENIFATDLLLRRLGAI